MLTNARLRFVGWMFLLAIVAISTTFAGAAEFDPQAFAKQLRAPPLAAKIVQRIATSDRFSSHATLSSDVSHAAVVVDGTHILVWETKSGQLVSPLNLRSKAHASALALSSSGKYFLLGRQTGNALLGECRTGKVVNVYKGLQSAVRAASITDDDKFDVLVEQNGTVHRYPLLGGESEKLRVDVGTDLTLADLSPCGRRAALVYRISEVTHVVSIPSEGPLTSEALSLAPVSTSLTNNKMVFGDTKARFGVLTFDKPGPPESKVYETFQRIGIPHLLRDNETVICFSNGYCQVANLNNWSDDQRLKLGTEEVQVMCLAGDGRTFLGTLGTGTEKVIGRIEGDLVPPQLQIDRTLSRLLIDKQFAALDQLFEEFEDDSQPFHWSPFRSAYTALGSRLIFLPEWYIPRATLAERLDEWRKERPDSVAAQLLCASQYIHDAWQLRGDGFADKVTPEGWDGFRKNIRKAHDLLLPLAEVEQPVPGVYSALFTIAMAESWSPETCAPFFEKLMKQAPLNIEGHTAVAQMHMVRWGGRPTDLHDYAELVANTIGGDAGDIMYARLACQQAGYYVPRQMFVDSGLSYERTQRGLEKLAEQPAFQRCAVSFALLFAFDTRNGDDLRRLVDAHAQPGDFHWPREIVGRKATLGTLNRLLRSEPAERADKIQEALKAQDPQSKREPIPVVPLPSAAPF